MLLFETILFYKGSPCFYKIYSKGESVYYYEAEPHFYYRNVPFPSFSVFEKNNKWEAVGLEDQEVLQQVIKGLQSHLQPSRS